MQPLTSLLRRALTGAPQETEQVKGLALPKRVALPVFGSDALSGVAYAPDEVIMILALAGGSAVVFSPGVGLAIGLILLVVIGTYRYNIREIAASGGDFQVVSERLGSRVGAAAGASLLFDFVLAVAVSVSAASSYLAVVIPAAVDHRIAVAVGCIVLLSLLFLRGLRFMAAVARIPAYVFGALMIAMILLGVVQTWFGALGRAPSAGYTVIPQEPGSEVLSGVELAILLARAFSAGAVTLTGVESVSNAVRFFRAPKASNAAAALMINGVASAGFLVGVLYLARMSGVVVTMDSSSLEVGGRVMDSDFHQMPVLAQVAQAVFGSGIAALLLAVVTAVLLLVATVSAYTGFPMLASTMAGRGYLPVHFRARTNTSLYANAVVVLGVVATVLVLAFRADVNALIQLYVLGALFSMSLTQAAVIRTRHRELRLVLAQSPRRQLLRAQAVTVLGFVATVLALAVVLVTKLWQGAWVSVVVVACLTWACLAVKKHYTRIETELAVTAKNPMKALPSRTHAIVLIPRLRRPALRAISWARAARPSTIEGVVLNVDEAGTRRIRKQWDEYEIPVPLTILASPLRDPVTPVVEHVRRLRAKSARDLTMVYLPEYVPDHWWQRLLHRRSAQKIAARLGKEPGVAIVMVPWRLGDEDDEPAAPAPAVPGHSGPGHTAPRKPGRAASTRGSSAPTASAPTTPASEDATHLKEHRA